MSKFWVITKEVYKKNIKSFGFLMMVLMPILVIGFIAAIAYFTSRETTDIEQIPIAVVTEDTQAQSLFAGEEWNFEVDATITTEEEAEDALSDETIEGYLLIDSTESGIQAEVVHANALNESIPLISEVLSNYQTMMRASELDLSQEEVLALSEPVDVQERYVSIEDGTITEDDSTDLIVQQFGAYFVSIAIMVFIMTYAGIIAEEVANEKGTRIMEVILSSASATNHFFGKLVGVMLVLLTQIGIYVVVALAALYYFRNSEIIELVTSNIDIGAMLQELMGYTLVFFITGVIMYVVLAAFFGSLATKMEDVNKAVTPIVFLALAGFYVGLFAFSVPDHTISIVSSYFPLFTPFVMPFRIASETVSTLGIWLSIVGTILFAGLITVVSLAFYRSNVLIYSDTNIFGTMKRSWKVMQSNRKAKRQRAS